ncbi:MAG: hypothetical protein K2Q12_00780, partial [Rickettsiales bacterium]|nr:hypothetical protein [Rickettsiales bacterium]
MHRLPGLLLHCSAILGFSAAVSANPWVQKTGHGIAIVNAVAYRTSHNFDTQGEQQSQPRFSKYELNPYLEYGLSDDWTIGTSLFLHKLQQATAEADQQNWGLGNSELFVRYQLWRKSRSAVTLEPFGALPAFYANAGSPRAGRDEGDLGLAVNAG